MVSLTHIDSLLLLSVEEVHVSRADKPQGKDAMDKPGWVRGRVTDL